MKVKLGKYRKDGNRKVEVRIDDYDAWSLDHTLALIIAPALARLKLNKHGAPLVANEDVPIYLHKSVDIEDEFEVDDNWFVRWDYVLDKMIKSFKMIIADESFGDGEKEAEIAEGLRLFGKYYRGLWD